MHQALSQTSPGQPDWDDVEGDDDADVELPDFAKMTLEQARQRCQAEAAAAAGTDGHMDGLDASTVPARSAKAVQVEELKAEIQGAAGAAQADDAAPPPSTEVNTEDPTAAVIEGGVEAAEGQLECDADEELKMEDPMEAKTEELKVQPSKDRGRSTCPAGHDMKHIVADGVYACDICGEDIPDKVYLHDCRQCDYCMCEVCYFKRCMGHGDGQRVEAGHEDEPADTP